MAALSAHFLFKSLLSANLCLPVWIIERQKLIRCQLGPTTCQDAPWNRQVEEQSMSSTQKLHFASPYIYEIFTISLDRVKKFSAEHNSNTVIYSGETGFIMHFPVLRKVGVSIAILWMRKRRQKRWRCPCFNESKLQNKHFILFLLTPKSLFSPYFLSINYLTWVHFSINFANSAVTWIIIWSVFCLLLDIRNFSHSSYFPSKIFWLPIY